MFRRFAGAIIPLLFLISFNAFSYDENYVFFEGARSQCFSTPEVLSGDLVLGATPQCFLSRHAYACQHVHLKIYIDLGFDSCPIPHRPLESQNIEIATAGQVMNCSYYNHPVHGRHSNQLSDPIFDAVYELAPGTPEANIAECNLALGYTTMPDCVYIDDAIGSSCNIAPTTICSDDYSISAGYDSGYASCDRPSLTFCDSDGSFVVGSCPIIIDPDPVDPDPVDPVDPVNPVEPIDPNPGPFPDSSTLAETLLSIDSNATGSIFEWLSSSSCNTFSKECESTLSRLIYNSLSSQNYQTGVAIDSLDDDVYDRFRDAFEEYQEASPVSAKLDNITSELDPINTTLNSLSDYVRDIDFENIVDTTVFDNSVSSINSTLSDITDSIGATGPALSEPISDVDTRMSNAEAELNDLIETIRLEFGTMTNLDLNTSTECQPVMFEFSGSSFNISPCRYFDQLGFIRNLIFLSALVQAFFIIFR